MRPTHFLLTCSFGVAFLACSHDEMAEGTSTDALTSHTGSRASLDGGRRDSSARDSGTTTSSTDGWVLTWSDEFDLANGSAVDGTKWAHEVGGSGWGNNEREYYTDGTTNSVIRDGTLVITATRDGASQYSCWYGTCEYTSARLNTKGKFTQTHGRLAARIKIPSGQGLWPAFWMLGDNIDTSEGQWPACGEIDIMENIGSEASIVHATIHGTGYSGSSGISASYTLSNGARFQGDFHVFATEWETNNIRFYVDDTLYATRTPSDLPSGGVWAFEHPFYLLLNVAVGGDWPKSPDSTTVFPQTMTVDWVRVYAR